MQKLTKNWSIDQQQTIFDCNFHFQRNYHYIPKNGQEDWIDSLFAPETNSKNASTKAKVLLLTKINKIVETAIPLAPSELNFHKNKSVFHNFQKHLLGLLKRTIVIRRCSLQNQRCGILAYNLWKKFLQCENSNKRILLLVFGESDKRKTEEADIIHVFETTSIEHSMKMHEKEELQVAQSLLRRKVLDRFEQFSRNFIQAQCKINKFDEFYEYLLAFQEELGKGPLKMRLSKFRIKQIKEKLLKRQN